MSRRDEPRLRPAAQFSDRTIADEAWATLMDAGIPSSVEHTPRSFGQGGYTRLFVPEGDVDRAQRLIAELVERDQGTRDA